MSLSNVIQTQLEGRIVRVAHLVEFSFKTQYRRVWNGSYPLTTPDGKRWFGIRKLGSIEGLDDDGNLTANAMKFSLSGVDARFLGLVKLALAESKAEYVGRLVRVYNCFFDADWQVLDAPVARAAGLMDRIYVERAQNRDDGSSRRVITITAQNIFYGRGIPPAGYFTDTDQKRRSPGDRGLEPVSAQQEVVVQVPW